jgi:hypothetical protein
LPIHMNGRVYSPELGRMISPDPVTQAPESGRNYNRYTYAYNNPLKYTDPSGFCGQELGSSCSLGTDISVPMLKLGGIPQAQTGKHRRGQGRGKGYWLSEAERGPGSKGGSRATTPKSELGDHADGDGNPSGPHGSLAPQDIPEGAYACESGPCYVIRTPTGSVGETVYEPGPDEYRYIEVNVLGKAGEQLASVLSAIPLWRADLGGIFLSNSRVSTQAVYRTRDVYQEQEFTYEVLYPDHPENNTSYTGTELVFIRRETDDEPYEIL